MPWLGLLLATAVAAVPQLAVNKWSGCGEVTSNSPFPVYFEPCATAEWEVLLDPHGVDVPKPSELMAKLKLPKAENLLGCAEHTLDFGGDIVLLQRGACYFSWKVLLAQAAGAGAVLIFDTAPVQVTAILAVPGPFENPRIPGYLISRSQGEKLLMRLEAGEEIQIQCSWSSANVWLDLPSDSLESNDSIVLQNYGDEEMPWVVDIIDNNASFETDPFYTAHLLGPLDHEIDHETSEMSEVAVFNTSAELDDDFHLLKLPFHFPHYLQFKDEVAVSANGVLVFDRVFSNLVGSIADSVAPAALIAPLWADLFGGTVSGRGDGERMVLHFDSFWLKPTKLLKEPAGPFTFDVWLFNDGEIRIHWDAFPNRSWSQLVEIGLEPGSGAKALPLELPWLQGPPLRVALVPWLRLSRAGIMLPPKEFLTLEMKVELPNRDFFWIFFYAKKSVGTWHPRRTVRLVQRRFRYVWLLSAWDGGLHSGSCATGSVRHRSRRCVGSDGAYYDDSYCVGSCLDIATERNFDYPVKNVWRDGYNNRCEDYRALSFCNETGYGPKWQSWWGTFEDWVSGELGAGEACCLCGGGQVSSPAVFEECPSIKCPVNSQGLSVLHGCSCLAGYEGQVTPSDQPPYYVGGCAPVACPKHSLGDHVADGCVCQKGYSGNIIPSTTEPFFVGGCEESPTSTATVTRVIGTSTSQTQTTGTWTRQLVATTSASRFPSSRPASLGPTLTLSTSMAAMPTFAVTLPDRRSIQVSINTTSETTTSETTTTDHLTSSFTPTSTESTASLQDASSTSTASPTRTSRSATRSTTSSTTDVISTWFADRSTSFTITSTLLPTASASQFPNLPTSTSTRTSSTHTISTAAWVTSSSTGESLELETPAVGATNLELSELAEPKVVAFPTSTTRKVAAMVIPDADVSGPSASAVVALLLIVMPCCACFFGAGRRLLACRRVKPAAVHPEPLRSAGETTSPSPSPPQPEMHSAPVTVCAVMR